MTLHHFPWQGHLRLPSLVLPPAKLALITVGDGVGRDSRLMKVTFDLYNALLPPPSHEQKKKKIYSCLKTAYSKREKQKGWRWRVLRLYNPTRRWTVSPIFPSALSSVSRPALPVRRDSLELTDKLGKLSTLKATGDDSSDFSTLYTKHILHLVFFLLSCGMCPFYLESF